MPARKPLALCALFALAAATAAPAAVFNVTTFVGLANAIAAASPGDVILVQPGIYAVDRSRTSFYDSGTAAAPITIRGVMSGGQRPILDAQGQDIDRGIFYIWPQTSHWIIENLEFRNSHGGQSYSGNAAAAYIRGDHVTFRNCYSHDNDNGWFSTAESEGILIERCETAFNGTGSGYTHNFYMNSVSITLRGCYTHDSVGGINYKDRSTHTVLEGNWFQDAGGYDIDWASNGAGHAVMIGNVIVRLSSAGNHKIVNFGDGTGTRGGTVALINNTIVAADDTYRVFERHASATVSVILENNVVYGSRRLFEGSATGWASYPTTGSSNWFPSSGAANVATHAPQLTASLFGTEPGFVMPSVLDYRLQATSPCRDSGDPAPLHRSDTSALVVRRPLLQYHEHLGFELRAVDAALDRGAFEHGAAADLAVAGSSSIATGGPFHLGIAGDPGALYYLFLDDLRGAPLTFPGIAGSFCLTPAANLVHLGRIAPAGVDVFSIPIPISAPPGLTANFQTLRLTPTGFTFSTDCPALVLMP